MEPSRRLGVRGAAQSDDGVREARRDLDVRSGLGLGLGLGSGLGLGFRVACVDCSSARLRPRRSGEEFCAVSAAQVVSATAWPTRARRKTKACIGCALIRLAVARQTPRSTSPIAHVTDSPTRAKRRGSTWTGLVLGLRLGLGLG